MSGESARSGTPWWRAAVVYQIYLRSFADGNGDGLGDLAGIRSRLPYLADLGVDAIWINPWYPSPMADAGYDVADYRDIEPRFGTLAEAETLIAEAHEHGLRVIADIVPNHTSDAHQWFREALAAGPGSAERARFHFRPGRGPDGDRPPNNWVSRFGGPAWTRVTEPDGRPGQWYLHLFAPEQPDLNWDNPEVHAEFDSILRFWFDRGIDGFRIDVAAALAKDPELPDLPDGIDDYGADGRHPFKDREELHDIYRGWRRIAEEYPGERIFVAEAWVRPWQRLARYLRPDGLHTAFNFDFLQCAWDASELREVIGETLSAVASVGAPATWVLSNHDVVRHVTRYGRADTGLDHTDSRQGYGTPADLDLGTRRARAAALLSLALPGGTYVYQGEELGLWEVEDLPEDRLQDPIWERTGHTARGRDGCRVPLPWSGTRPPFGFSPPGSDAEPWLPQPESFRGVSVEVEAGDPTSMLELYRHALRLRRDHPALGDGTLRWLETPPDVLGFVRDAGFVCLVNLSPEAFPLAGLPAGHRKVLLASGPLDGDRLPPDTAVWLEELE